MKNIKEVLSQNLRRLRGGRTQSEIAESAGIPFRTYQDAEGGRIPRAENLSAIAKALNVSEVELFLEPGMISEELHADEIDKLKAEITKLRDDLTTQYRLYNKAIGIEKPMPFILPGLSRDRRDFLALIAAMNDEQVIGYLTLIKAAVAAEDATAATAIAKNGTNKKRKTR